MRQSRIFGLLGRRGAWIVLLCVGLVGSTWTAAKADAPSPEANRAAGQLALEQMVVAPCCWRKTVAEEGTPQANEVREMIAGLLGKGFTRDQVLDALVERYSERILVRPRTQGFNLVLYALPAVALAFGLVLLILLLKKWGARPAAAAAAAGDPSVSVDPSLIRRVEEELARMD